MFWSLIRNRESVFVVYIYWLCYLYSSSSFAKSILHHSCLLGRPKLTGNFVTHESIVILHGLLGSSKNFQAWSKILSVKTNQEYDIICMDLRYTNVCKSFLGDRNSILNILCKQKPWTLSK